MIAKADGTGVHELVSTDTAGAYVIGESWSPDGKQILLSRSPTNAFQVPAISVIDADGTNEQQLIAAGNRAAWSPDGRRFAYVAYTIDGKVRGLGVADADGRDVHILFQGNVVARPSWSPDGGELAYVASSDGIKGSLGVVRANGSDARVLTSRVISPSVGGSTPQWSPDGSLIAFTRGPYQASRVAVIKPNGGGEQLVPDSIHSHEPVWRVPAALPSHRRPCVVHGTSRNDVIHGTSRGDVIFAGCGADRVYGGGGPDVLVGDLGADRLFQEGGEDEFGARDRTRDHVIGGRGKDARWLDYVDVRSTLERSHH